jgi:hypothetical protein
MIDSFRTPTTVHRYWWQRFTGEALEREITFWHACRHLEATASYSKQLAHKVRQLRVTLAEEQRCAHEYTQWLQQLLDIAHTVLSTANAKQRDAPQFKAVPEYWIRFSRRVENLNMLHTATLLSVAQFKLADTQAQSVLDRYAEIVTLLVPLWRQRMGFELFSRQTDANGSSSEIS